MWEYMTETYSSSWGGSLGVGYLQTHLNERDAEGWELVSSNQILKGHDMTGQVGLIWRRPRKEA